MRLSSSAAAHFLEKLAISLRIAGTFDCGGCPGEIGAGDLRLLDSQCLRDWRRAEKSPVTPVASPRKIDLSIRIGSMPRP